MNPTTPRGASAPARRARPSRPLPIGLPTDARPGPRHHAVDALRGAAMFLVVTLHAALAYTRTDIPRLLWGVRERSTHHGFDLFCWWAMGVSLPLFFLIGGFFAAELTRTRGLAGFARNRAARIGGPFAAGCVLILPWCFLAWADGWLVTGASTFREILRMRFLGPGVMDELYGPAHLWFLEYLILMLLAFGAVRWLGRDRNRAGAGEGDGPSGRLDAWLASPWRPLVPALPTAVLLWAGRECVGIDPVYDRHNSFAPDLIRLLHHGLFFAVGVRLNRFRADLSRFTRPGPLYLALSAPVFVVRAWLLPRDWSESGIGDGPLSAGGGVLLVAAGAAFAWLTLFGFLGVFLRAFDRPRAWVRFLADASYWVYLVHFPVVGFAQADLFPLRLPTVVKFPAVLAVTLALGLGSYWAFVRHTPLGRWLHGPRARRPGGRVDPAGQPLVGPNGSR